MNRDEIIEMAREAGVYVRGYYDETGSTPEELERFFHAAYAAGAAAEREACAKHFERLSGTEWLAENVADEIRARSEK